MSLARRLLPVALAVTFPCLSWTAAKPHTVVLGAARKQPYSMQGDPAGARADETELKVRPLVVDGKVKEWTTGQIHEITERSFTVRRAIRINDSLPADTKIHWVWQRGPWLLIDRTSGKVSALHLPDFASGISDLVWFRDYAAYCGLNPTGKQLFAIVAQVEARRPLLARKLAPWNPVSHPAPACAAAEWQRDPLKVTFQPTRLPAVSFDLVGASAILVEDGDSDNP